MTRISTLNLHVQQQVRRSNMKRLSLLVASIFIAASALGQTSENTKSAGPGASYPPIGDIHAHVCGIHFYNGDMSRQIIAEHSCAHRSDEVLQSKRVGGMDGWQQVDN